MIVFYIVAACPPVNIEHGKVEYNSSEVNGSYLTDTIASFTGDDEFVRNGSFSSTCQESAIWNPDVPTCERGISLQKLGIKN